MRAADLHDIDKFARFGVESVAQVTQGRQQRTCDGTCRSNMHCRRKNIVRRLAHVDIIVRMHQPFFAPHAAHEFRCAIGDHFIHVHIGLRTGAGLPYRQGKFVIVQSCNHFIGTLHDGTRLVAIKLLQILVDHRTGALDHRQCNDQFMRHALGRNMKMKQRTLRLRTP